MNQDLKLAELVTVIETDAPEDSIGIIVIKTKEHFDIYVEALVMYAFLKDMQAPIYNDMNTAEYACVWCDQSEKNDASIVHLANCRWTASRQILERIEKVD